MKSNFVFLLILALLSFISAEECSWDAGSLISIMTAFHAQKKNVNCAKNASGVCECTCV